MAGDLAAELEALVKAEAKIHRRCISCALPQKLRTFVEEQFSKHGRSVPILCKLLEQNGHPVYETTLRRHLKMHIK